MLIGAAELRSTSIDSAILYTNKLYQRAIEGDFLFDQLNALIQLGELNLQAGNSNVAYEQISLISKLGENSNLLKMKLEVNLGLGRLAFIESSYKSCLEYYFAAIGYAKLPEDQFVIGKIYFQIASVYFRLNDYDNCKYYLQKTENSGYTDPPENKIQLELVIGDMYLVQREFDSAFSVYQRIKIFAEKLPDNNILLGVVYANLAKYYITLGKLIEAEENCKLGIKYYKLGHQVERVAALYTYLAHIYSLNNDYTNALIYNRKALNIRQKVGVKTLIISSLNNIGNDFSALEKSDSAILYFNKALAIEKDNKSNLYVADIYKNLYRHFLRDKNYNLALEYYRLHRDYSDSLMMGKNNRALSEIHVKFELEQEKNKRKSLDLSKSKTIQLLLISFSVILLFVMALLFKRFREKRFDNLLLQKNNATIKQKNQQLDEAMKELRASEQKYRTLSNNLPGVIFRLESNPDQKMIFYNHLLFNLSGYTEDELHQHHNDILDRMILPDDLVLLKEARQKAFLENKPYNIIYRFVHRGSTLKYFNEIGIPVESSSTDYPAFEGLIFDVTDKKIIEHDLVLALEKAKESDRLKSTFLSTISHELRTPLNAIIGFSSLIEYDTPPNQVVEYLSIVQKSGDHLLELVEDLFDISLIETNNIPFNQSTGNLSDTFKLVDNLIRIEQEKQNKKQVTINLHIPDDRSMKIHTDLRKLMQILINLLKNALKFTAKGTINYGFRVEKQGTHDFYQFFVIDTGIGIQSSKVNFIFDIFRQADDSHTREYEGAGIGLSVAKSYVELLGGRIWVDTKLGQGSGFYFTLPADLPIEESQEEGVSVPFEVTYDKPGRVEGKTILIVEDIPSSHALLKILLEREGLHTIWAKNGKQAVELCHTTPEISLVLMDLKMPDMSGYVATRIIKEDFPRLPIIAQTAYAVEGDREKALSAGFDEYIEKPIQKHTLLRLVNLFLSKME